MNNYDLVIVGGGPADLQQLYQQETMEWRVY